MPLFPRLALSFNGVALFFFKYTIVQRVLFEPYHINTMKAVKEK